MVLNVLKYCPQALFIGYERRYHYKGLIAAGKVLLRNPGYHPARAEPQPQPYAYAGGHRPRGNNGQYQRRYARRCSKPYEEQGKGYIENLEFPELFVLAAFLEAQVWPEYVIKPFPALHKQIPTRLTLFSFSALGKAHCLPGYNLLRSPQPHRKPFHRGAVVASAASVHLAVYRIPS